MAGQDIQQVTGGAGSSSGPNTGGFDTSQLTTIANSQTMLIQALSKLTEVLEIGLDQFNAANKMLSNLTTTAINAALNPATDNTLGLGTSLLRWASAFITNITSTNVVASVLGTRTTTAQTLNISAYDVDGAAYTNFITLTSGNTPTCNLSDSVTKAGNYIYRAGGTDIPIADGGTGASTAVAARTNLLIVTLTQSQYDGLTPNATTLYFITGP
jgi:hypothetical protein